MAAHSPRKSAKRAPGAAPVLPLVLAGIVAAVLTFIPLRLFVFSTESNGPPPPPAIIVQGFVPPANEFPLQPPMPELPTLPPAKAELPTPPLSKPEFPKFVPDSVRREVWWDGPEFKSTALAAAKLKSVVPQNAVWIDGVGNPNFKERLDAYRIVLTRVSDLLQLPGAREPLVQFLVECFAKDPFLGNSFELSKWIGKQVPKEEDPFPPNFRNADLERSLLALDVAVVILTGEGVPPDRKAELVNELGEGFKFALDREAVPVDEVGPRAQKLAALRLYRKLLPTAQRSVGDALATRLLLLEKLPQHYAPKFRTEGDLQLAFAGLPKAKDSWTAYRALVEDCSKSDEKDAHLGLVALYQQADAQLAAKLESLVSGRLKVALDAGKSQEEKAKALYRTLGVRDPKDRLTRLEDLAQSLLASASEAAEDSHRLLEDSAELAHASTLACALFRENNAKFDDWIAKAPKLEKDKIVDPDEVIAKPKAKPGAKPGTTVAEEVIGTTPKLFKGQLELNAPEKNYAFPLRGGRTYAINMSANFDSFLNLYTSQNVLLMSNDDGGLGYNARIIFTAPASGVYRVQATSVGRGLGYFQLQVQEVPRYMDQKFGFGGPPFFDPFRPFGFAPIPGPGMPVPNPKDPEMVKKDDQGKNDNPNKKDDEKGDKTEKSSPPELNKEDAAKLSKNYDADTRSSAFRRLAAKLTGDLVQNDLTPKDAKKLAEYLASATKAEVDHIAEKLALLGRSRQLLLALADGIEVKEAAAIPLEIAVGALLEKPVQFKAADWKPACRKHLLLRAVELRGQPTLAADRTADLFRNYYQDQAVLLGAKQPDPKRPVRPTQAIEGAIDHAMAKLRRQNLSPEDEKVLNEATREILAARFAARNDLEHAVLLQRVWYKVLSVHLASHVQAMHPERAQKLRGAATQESAGAAALEQLRSGEAQILRLWMLAHETN